MRIGYIFDCDGVLVNNMEVHFRCHEKALLEEGVPTDKAEFFFLAGMTGREMIGHFADKAGRTVDIEKVYHRKAELFASFIDRITTIECNLQILRALRGSGFPVAIASGSSHKSLDPVLQRYAIVVDAVVTSEDVERGKPHPDLFLAAAERIGVAPADCLVIEDSDVGIEAAQRAGMRAMRFFDLQPAGNTRAK